MKTSTRGRLSIGQFSHKSHTMSSVLPKVKQFPFSLLNLPMASPSISLPTSLHASLLRTAGLLRACVLCDHWPMICLSLIIILPTYMYVQIYTIFGNIPLLPLCRRINQFPFFHFNKKVFISTKTHLFKDVRGWLIYITIVVWSGIEWKLVIILFISINVNICIQMRTQGLRLYIICPWFCIIVW